ncbi:MAG TPA: molybdate ABC transporter substrate-binding protein [Pyrinomonadaceae bacterium]|nr:molybdate ABC transporter substrate-binding protein [Pyrinomonadaceae bacterium]
MVKGPTRQNLFELHDVCIRKHARIVLAITLIIFSGCRARTARNGEKPSSEILVAAAANLTDAFQELSRRFSERTGIRVILSFGGTADLAKQIENGAPFDIFAAADSAHVEALEQKGLLTPGTRALYARGSLVLWVPAGSTINVERVEDLQRKEVERIAIAKPDIAPYGQAAVETLRALKMWDQVEPKVVYGMNVSQVKQFVSSGNAEAGFLPRALVKPGEGKYIEIGEELHRPIDQALGVIKASEKQDAAHRFADFVLSPEGQLILREYGYKPPTP